MSATFRGGMDQFGFEEVGQAVVAGAVRQAGARRVEHLGRVGALLMASCDRRARVRSLE